MDGTNNAYESEISRNFQHLVERISNPHSEVYITSQLITTNECFVRQENETLRLSLNSIRLRKFYLNSTILNLICKYFHSPWSFLALFKINFKSKNSNEVDCEILSDCVTYNGKTSSVCAKINKQKPMPWCENVG